MLSDQELTQAGEKLTNFQNTHKEQQENLSQLLQQYDSLLESYKRLKSDYEEEREARERYKQLARGQERNPFVLVLIDGDSYVFDEHLIRAGADGGKQAAKVLQDAVKNSLRFRGLEHCRIMVRIYSNLAGLSKACYKAGAQCGPEKRSMVRKFQVSSGSPRKPSTFRHSHPVESEHFWLLVQGHSPPRPSRPECCHPVPTARYHMLTLLFPGPVRCSFQPLCRSHGLRRCRRPERKRGLQDPRHAATLRR
jgi:hypothetical protein